MPINLPGEVAHDIRQPILGDSFGWDGLEAAEAKKSIVIHGTGSEAPLEDGFTMADYHVNHNGWGGIGVHFVITEDGYPGKPQFGLPAGVQVQYVGDLLTWRAGCFDQNPGRIHIEISGLLENHPPTANQLRALRGLIDFLLAPNNLLPSLNYYSQVTYHNAVPEQNTACPGWAHPSFPAWFGYLQNKNPFPDELYALPTAPVEVIPEAPVVLPTPTPDTPGSTNDLVPPGQGGGIDVPVTVIPPEYEATYREQASVKIIQRADAVAVFVPSLTPIESSRAGLVIDSQVDVAGYFDFQGVTYARTVWSATHNTWNGIDSSFFDLPTGQLNGPVPISTPTVATPAPDPLVLTDPTAVASDVTDEELKEATVPLTPKVTLLQKFIEWLASVYALIIKKKG